MKVFVHIPAVALLIVAFVSAGTSQEIRGTLIVAVPVRDGLVVCADKRLYNNQNRSFSDNNVKVRKAGRDALFVATNTVGFYDQKTRSMAFDAFKVTENYLAKTSFDRGKVFWNGLKREITTELRSYFAKRKFSEWPESDRANSNLLFNLIFYSIADDGPRSHSLRVFYEKKRTPVIYISDPVNELIRKPKLAGKGREVMAYLNRNPAAAADPLILQFDETRFDPDQTSAEDAVAFAQKLFKLTSTGVPRANVSSTSDCELLQKPAREQGLNDRLDS